MPCERRQLELSEKYFFACAYSPCGRTASHGPVPPCLVGGRNTIARSDPVSYQQRFYPIRVVDGFKLANLLSQILGVDYRKVDWRLLRECAAQVGWSHGGGVVFAGVVSRRREKRGLIGVRLEDIVLEAEVEKIVSMVEDLTKELQR
ncbi:unnamed protein product [Tuber aestivum]|uniref:Uncharacterized protein n=1 Tax=Tuber aestivum TaxID=59557 RepID=A0A292Q9Z9_9PEZI|nr:unnamed protein product [Tuber aestivum]